MAVFFALYIVLLSQIQLCMTTEITDPPISKSGLLYTAVEFSCKGIGDSLVWSIAHDPLNDTTKQEHNITVIDSNTNGILSSNLTILALPINNKIEIGCVVISFKPTLMAVAQEAKLTVTGVSSVVNVEWHSNPNLLTWSSPLFYFDGSSNHAEFVYYILLNDVDMINTTNTSVYLNISNCAFFTVCITVYADQYVSQENNQVYLDTGNYTVNIINRTVPFVQGANTVNIILTNLVTFADYVCNNTIYVRGSAINEKNGKQMLYPSLKFNSNNLKEIIMHYKMTNLMQNSIYTIGIYVSDLFNVTKAQNNITIPTYNVQDFSIDVNSNGSVTVKCVFMQGSINESCYLLFLDAAQGLNKSYIVAGSTNITLTESGNYTVKVYELFNGAIYGPVIEPELIEVIIISPSASSEQPSTVYTTTSISTSNITPSSIITPTSSNNPLDRNVYILIATVVSLIVVTVILMLLLCLCIKKKAQQRGCTLSNNTDNKEYKKKMEHFDEEYKEKTEHFAKEYKKKMEHFDEEYEEKAGHFDKEKMKLMKNM